MKLLRYLAPCALAGFLLLIGFVSLAAEKPNGHTIFEDNCSMCHGVDGKGYTAIKTPNFTDPKWQAAHTDKELRGAIENGVKGTAMVSFKGKLSADQMTAVLKYIRSFNTKSQKT